MLINQPVRDALNFWSLFNRGLTIEQLATITSLPPNLIQQELASLQAKKTNNVWHLGHLDQTSNSQHSHLIQKYLPGLRFIPGVRGVAVCNSTALGTSTTNSDIDLFIILNQRIFFTSRLLVSCYFQLLGLRRTSKAIKNRFCLSFFVGDQNLELTNTILKNDFYFYYWFRTLQWHITPANRDQWLQSFLQANNNWLNQFTNQPIQFPQVEWQKSSFEWQLISKLLSWIETFNRNWQLKRALKKNQQLRSPQGVIIQPGLLKFHVIDKRADFNKRHQDRILKKL